MFMAKPKEGPQQHTTQPSSYDALTFTEKRPGSLQLATPPNPNTINSPKWVAITVLALLAVMFAALTLHTFQGTIDNKKPFATSTPTQTPQTVGNNLKMYTNGNLAFSFMYPLIWEIDDDVRKSDPDELQKTTFDIISKDKKSIFGTLYYYENPENISLQAFEQKRKEIEKSNQVQPVYQVGDKTTQNRHGLTIFRRDNTFCEPVICHVYIWPTNNRIYMLLNFTGKQEDQDNLFDTVVDTLKLTTTNTFIDNRLNFSFNYPSTAVVESIKGDAGTDITIENGTETVWLDVFIYPTDQDTIYTAQKVVKTLTFNGLIWNLHAESEFCEGMDNCGTIEPTYTTKYNGRIVTIHPYFDGENSPLIMHILSTFKMLDFGQNDKTYQCGFYTNKDLGRPDQACAVCGNGVCEAYEECTTNEYADMPCGKLYCEKDCKK